MPTVDIDEFELSKPNMDQTCEERPAANSMLLNN